MEGEAIIAAGEHPAELSSYLLLENSSSMDTVADLDGPQRLVMENQRLAMPSDKRPSGQVLSA